MEDRENGSESRLIASDPEAEDGPHRRWEREVGGSAAAEDEDGFEGVFSLTTYPESPIKLAAWSKGSKLLASSGGRLGSLSEATSEVDYRWDEESIGAGEVSVDEERISDPKGTRAMEERWSNLLEGILGKRGYLARPDPSEDTVAEAADQLERGEAPRTPVDEDEVDEERPEQQQDGQSTGRTWDVSRKSLEKKNRSEVFWTRSRYEGFWDTDLDIPSGKGAYRLPHGATYAGDMYDGQLEGHGVMRYPDGTTVEGVWRDGRLQEGTLKVTFRDALTYDLEDWDYCIPPDRRFHIERLYGLRGAGRSHLTQGYPTRSIPVGCYDSGDGFYDPSTRCVVSSTALEKVLRIPTNSEAEIITKTCRKAWDENVNYSPDVFANTYDSDDLEILIPSPVKPDHLEVNGIIENEQKPVELETKTSLSVLELPTREEKDQTSSSPSLVEEDD